MTTRATRATLTALYDDRSQAVDLGICFGHGREGAVHIVENHDGLVAKIPHRQPLPEDLVAKLRFMVDNPPPVRTCSAYRLAWPASLITRPKRNGKPVGVLIPLIDLEQFQEIGAYFNPLRRRRLLSFRERPYTALHLLTMAQNLAHAVAHIHAQGHVIGDLNSRNVLANDRAQVALIDTDSYQITDAEREVIHRCTVGTPEYTAPRLQEVAFTDQDRNQEDDLFALGVIIYQLLSQGQHPFSGSYHGEDHEQLNTVAQRIGRATFVHGTQSRFKHQPSWATRIIWRDSPLKKEFRAAFRRRGARTTAAEWVIAIEAAAQSLTQCTRHPQHYHFGKRYCTWCVYRNNTHVEPFPRPAPRNTA